MTRTKQEMSSDILCRRTTTAQCFTPQTKRTKVGQSFVCSKLHEVESFTFKGVSCLEIPIGSVGLPAR